MMWRQLVWVPVSVMTVVAFERNYLVLLLHIYWTSITGCEYEYPKSWYHLLLILLTGCLFCLSQSSWMQTSNSLTHCGLVTPYGITSATLRSFGSPDHFGIFVLWNSHGSSFVGLFCWKMASVLNKNFDHVLKTVTLIKVLYQCQKKKKKKFF